MQSSCSLFLGAKVGLAAVEREPRRAEVAVRETMTGKVRDLTKGGRYPQILGSFAFPPPQSQAPFLLTIYRASAGSKSQGHWETVIHVFKLTGHSGHGGQRRHMGPRLCLGGTSTKKEARKRAFQAAGQHRLVLEGRGPHQNVT